MTTTAIASGASTPRFFDRELSVAESRFVALSAAVAAAILVGLLQRTWISIWAAVALVVIALANMLLIRIPQSRTLVLGFAIVIWLSLPGRADADWQLLLVAFGVPLGTLVFTWQEGRRGLRRAALLCAIRDVLWRMTAMVAVVIVALAAADRVERAAFETAYATPLEGLTFAAGILAGILLLIVMLWVVWSLPRIAAKRMTAGLTLPSATADALWFGTLLLMVGIVFDVRAIASSGTFSEDLGLNCWLAAAAALAFAGARLWFPVAIDVEIQALWIVFLGNGSSRAMQRHAALLAARWRNGPVTIVARPEVAVAWRGAHLRLAQLRGEVEALFPQRPIHFADWMDTLPPQKRWQALPIRELYVDDALWSDLFEAQLAADALIVVIDDQQPEDKTIDRLRAYMPTNRTDFHLPVIDSTRLAERWPGVEIYPIVGAGDPLIDQWIATNGKVREAAAALRYALIAHVERDTRLAKDLAVAMDRKVDGRGKTIRASTVSVDHGGAWSLAWRRANINFWRLGVMVKGIRETSRGRWYEPLASLVAFIISFGIDAEYDLLVVENDLVTLRHRMIDEFTVTTTVSNEPSVGIAGRLVWDLVGQDGVKFANRVIAIRRPGISAWSQLLYGGVLPLDLDPAPDEQLANVARRYLATDFEPPVSAPPPQPAAAPPDPVTRRSRVFIVSSSKYQALVKTLAARLADICDVQRWDASAIDPGVQDMPNPDALIAIVDMDSARSMNEWPKSPDEPILPIIIGRIEVPSFLVGTVPVNADAYGNLLDLTGDLEGAEDAWQLTVENIDRALQRIMASEPTA